MGFELSGFQDKIAVVTGAGRMRSIGRSIALALAQAGCDVVVTGTGRSADRYTDEEKAANWRDIESVVEEIEGLGRRALAVVSDVSDLGSVQSLADRVQSEFGGIDFIVNNASYARGTDRTPVIDLDPEVWQRVLNTNLTGCFYMSKVFGRMLREQKRGGAIVNISSTSGKTLPPAIAAYAASKAGMHALTVSMAKDVAGAGIRVNAICPGVVDTSRLDDFTDAIWNQVLKQLVPLGQRGQGADIAAMVVFLCSEQARWITGQLYNVDGGQTHV